MYWQKEYLRTGSAMTLASTWQEDLPKTGLLGSILCYISGPQGALNGATGGKFKISDFIDKLEIIADGAHVIKSLTGHQAQAIGLLDQKVTSPDMIRNYATNDQRAYFLLNFGRKMLDRAMGLDLSKWKNIEIKITNSAAAANFTALSIDVLCIYKRDDDAAGFAGCIYSENWREYAPAAGSVQYLEIPDDWLVRRILLQPTPGFNGTTEEWNDTLNNLMYQIELSYRTGQDRVYKDGFQMLMISNYLEFGAYVLCGGLLYPTADHALDLGAGYTMTAVTGTASKDDTAAAVDTTINADISSNILKAETYEADHPFYALLHGLAYQRCGVFKFDYEEDPGTWLNTREKGTVKLDITTRSTATITGAKNRILIERAVM